MTPTTLKIIILIIFIIIFISIIIINLISINDFEIFGIMFALFIVLCGATFAFVCEHSTYKEYSSQEYDVDNMVKIIPKEHFKEENKYDNYDKSPHKVLIHETLFKTEEWKLIEYIPTENETEDEYEKFKLSKTKSD